MCPGSPNEDSVGPATGSELASGESGQGSPCLWGQITLQTSLAGSGSEGGDAPRCAPHSVVAGDNPRTGIGRQRTRRSGRGPQKPRLPASCTQMQLAQPGETSARPTAGGQRGGGGGGGARAGQHRVAKMFDSSQYPYNCFNDDADDYPAGSSDEEKRLTRPAYR